MMAVDRKQIEAAKGIDLTRAYAASDRVIAERQMQERFLARAVGEEGESRCWYVLRTSNHCEKDVYNLLHDVGIKAWLPTKIVYTVVKYTHRKRKSETPLFRNYLFVRATPCAESWVALGAIKGVESVLCVDGRPLPVDDETMNNLIELHDSGFFNERRSEKPYQLGEMVEITSGAFAMFKGPVDGYVGKRSVRVLASIFGRHTPVELTLDQIAKAY